MFVTKVINGSVVQVRVSNFENAHTSNAGEFIQVGKERLHFNSMKTKVARKCYKSHAPQNAAKRQREENKKTKTTCYMPDGTIIITN